MLQRVVDQIEHDALENRARQLEFCARFERADEQVGLQRTGHYESIVDECFHGQIGLRPGGGLSPFDELPGKMREEVDVLYERHAFMPFLHLKRTVTQSGCVRFEM